jgi:hypothetical protein
MIDELPLDGKLVYLETIKKNFKIIENEDG